MRRIVVPLRMRELKPMQDAGCPDVMLAVVRVDDAGQFGQIEACYSEFDTAAEHVLNPPAGSEYSTFGPAPRPAGGS